MKRFKIIPVIDILNSRAVHAKKGERTNYRTLKSNLFHSADPVEIISTLKNKYKFNCFYIADLDSIMKKAPNIQILKKILQISEISIMLDPGITELEDLYQFQELKVNNMILGLETIKNIKVIVQSLEIFNRNDLIISIDMYNGNIISNVTELKTLNPIKLIKTLDAFGIRNIILLDLFRVGQKIGGIPDLYLKILHNFSGNVFIGGGIKNYSDIVNIRDSNFSGALIATALYDRTINIEKLSNFR